MRVDTLHERDGAVARVVAQQEELPRLAPDDHRGRGSGPGRHLEVFARPDAEPACDGLRPPRAAVLVAPGHTGARAPRRGVMRRRRTARAARSTLSRVRTRPPLGTAPGRIARARTSRTSTARRVQGVVRPDRPRAPARTDDAPDRVAGSGCRAP